MTELLSSAKNSNNFLREIEKNVHNEELLSRIINLSSRNDKERSTMVIQNVESTTRNAFQFHVFSKPQKISKSNLTEIKEDIKEIDEKKKLEEIIKVPNSAKNNLNSFKKINENIVNAHYFVKTQDYYREVVAEKFKIEIILRKELIEVAEKLFLKKLEKKYAEEDLNKVLSQMQMLKEEYLNEVEDYKDKVRKLKNTFKNLIREMKDKEKELFNFDNIVSEHHSHPKEAGYGQFTGNLTLHPSKATTSPDKSNTTNLHHKGTLLFITFRN